MNRFPHTITVASEALSTRENGNWLPGTPNTNTVLTGRYEPQTNAAVTGTDGSVIKVSGILYLPPTAPYLTEGTALTVMNGTEQKAKGTVKQFDRTRLNARAWL